MSHGVRRVFEWRNIVRKWVQCHLSANHFTGVRLKVPALSPIADYSIIRLRSWRLFHLSIALYVSSPAQRLV